MPLYCQVARVEGSSYFPLDMLRYDHCYPEGDLDVTKVGLADRANFKVEPRRFVVHVARVVSNKNETWTIGRWKSFGWTCIPERCSKL